MEEVKAEEKVVEELPKKNNHKWGLVLGIISLVIAVVGIAPGYLSIVPILGLAFAIITLIMAGVALVLGFIGMFGTRVKWPSIVGMSISVLLIAWGLVRIFLLYTVISPIEFN